MSLVWLTMSKALEKSIDMVSVRCGGKGWLKPLATACVRGRSAVVVEWFARKPCCVGETGRAIVSSGRRRRSSTLAAGQRREIGLYPDPELTGLPGFGIGTMIARFQMDGISALL